MFDKLFAKFKKQPAPAPAPDVSDDMEIAIAALLVEAARADERYEDHEKLLIDKTLAAKFDLSAQRASALRAKGEAAQHEAIDIHRFTRIAKAMDGAEKIALIEQLWEIVLSDGDRDPHEDTLIRRICGLIYVNDPDSGAARLRIEAKLAGQ